MWKLCSKVGRAALLAGLTAAQCHAGLLGFYPFDDEADPRKDESVSAPTPGLGFPLEGSGDPATDPVYSANGGFSGSGAYVFDGTQRLMTLFDIDAATYPQLSMGAWVKTSTLTPGLRKIIGQDNGGWDRVIGLDTRPSDTHGFSTFTGSGVLNSEVAPSSVDQWSFVAVTFNQDTSEINLYVDLNVEDGGTLDITSGSGTFGFGFSQAAIGGIRPDSASEAWQGAIDNVFFYDEVLSPAQLTVIRDRGKNAILGIGGGDDPDLTVTTSPDVTSLPRTPQTQTLTYSLFNSGVFNPLQISSVTVTGPDASHFSGITFPASIAPQSSGNITLQFDNRGQVGAFNAQVRIASNDATTPVVVIDLTPRVTAPSLLGFYSFDDTANPLKDDSGANRTLTAPAAPTYQESVGISGGSYLFDGNQRLAAPININPATVPNLTMGAWVRTDALDGFHKIMGHDNGGWDRALGLDGRGAAGLTHYTAFAGGDRWALTDPLAMPESTEAWSFVAVVYEQPRNLATTYIDMDVSTTEDSPMTGTVSTTMGSGHNTVGIGSLNPTGNAETWVGNIDNVFFFSGALTADQMKTLRDQGKTFALQFLPDPIIGVNGATPFGELQNSSSVTRNIVISNTGSTQPLRISRIDLTGVDASLYSLGTIPTEIAPGAQATVPVTINPGARTGPITAQVDIYSNNSAARMSMVSLNAYVPYASQRAALAGFYPFDNTENPLADASGNNATLEVVPNAEPFFDATAGLSGGGAYLFDGFQRLASPVNINPVLTPKLTMGAWVKATDISAGNRKVLGHDNGGWDRAIGLDVRGNGGLTTHHYTSFAGGDRYPLSDPPATPVSPDEWAFIAAVYDQFAGTVNMYVDLNAATTEDALLTGSTTTTFDSGGNDRLGIGALSPAGGEGWFGVIDNVFVFRTALTADQIAAIRNGGPAAILASEPAGLEITGVSRDADLELTWSSEAGSSYQVQYSATVNGTYETIATMTATGASTTYTDTDATRLARSTGFYRVVRP